MKMASQPITLPLQTTPFSRFPRIRFQVSHHLKRKANRKPLMVSCLFPLVYWNWCRKYTIQSQPASQPVIPSFSCTSLSSLSHIFSIMYVPSNPQPEFHMSSSQKVRSQQTNHMTLITEHTDQKTSIVNSRYWSFFSQILHVKCQISHQLITS